MLGGVVCLGLSWEVRRQVLGVTFLILLGKQLVIEHGFE